MKTISFVITGVLVVGLISLANTREEKETSRAMQNNRYQVIELATGPQFVR